MSTANSTAPSVAANDLFALEGAVALVTGGGTGLGLMAARALASQGAKVYITGRRAAVLSSAASTHNASVSARGGSLVPLELDVCSKASLESAAAELTQREGKLHILVNNAGVEGPVTRFSPGDLGGDGARASEAQRAAALGQLHLASEDFAGWSGVFAPNTSALFFASMAFLALLARGNADPPLHKRGDVAAPHRWTAAIINVTSISGLVKLSQAHYAYNASKAAANHVTQMLAHELRFSAHGPQVGVRVNAIAPGLFATEMTTKKATLDSGGVSSAEDVDPAMANPAGRLGAQEDMAQAVLFFSSCLFATGQVLAVDGGWVTAAPGSR